MSCVKTLDTKFASERKHFILDTIVCDVLYKNDQRNRLVFCRQIIYTIVQDVKDVELENDFNSLYTLREREKLNCLKYECLIF